MGFEKFATAPTEEEEDAEKGPSTCDVHILLFDTILSLRKLAYTQNYLDVICGLALQDSSALETSDNAVKLWRPRPLNNRELIPPHFPPAAAHPAHPAHHGEAAAAATAAAAAMAMAAANNPMLRQQYSMFGMNHHGSPFQHPKHGAVRFSDLNFVHLVKHSNQCQLLTHQMILPKLKWQKFHPIIIKVFKPSDCLINHL